MNFLEVKNWIDNPLCNGPPGWGIHLTNQAAKNGLISVLKYLRHPRDIGRCPWGMRTTATAAMYGKLETLIWLVKDKMHYGHCPIGPCTLYAAIIGRRFNIVEWYLRKKWDFPYDPIKACKYSITHGYLPLVQSCPSECNKFMMSGLHAKHQKSRVWFQRIHQTKSETKQMIVDISGCFRKINYFDFGLPTDIENIIMSYHTTESVFDEIKKIRKMVFFEFGLPTDVEGIIMGYFNIKSSRYSDIHDVTKYGKSEGDLTSLIIASINLKSVGVQTKIISEFKMYDKKNDKIHLKHILMAN